MLWVKALHVISMVAIRKAAYALSDEISDLNKAKLSIELETEVASAAGL